MKETIIITSGSKYIDIDAYASCIAYANLLNLNSNRFLVGNSPKVIINLGFKIFNCSNIIFLQFLEQVFKFFLSIG